MSNMPYAPLVYTLGVVRFPQIPNIGTFKDAFLGAFRNTYPQFDEISLNFVKANISVVGADTKIDSRESKMYQFASPDREWALFLNDGLLGLHTSKYVDHEDFVQRFREALQMLLGVQDLGLEWIEAIGFRYIDLVNPRKGEQLDVYLNEWVLPPHPEVKGKMELVRGMYIAMYKTEHGNLRFQCLRNPPTTLPPDLNSPLVQNNGWVPETPEGDFALMDIDHGDQFNQLQKMDVNLICQKLRDLRSSSRELFDHAGTEHAMQVWKGEV